MRSKCPCGAGALVLLVAAAGCARGTPGGDGAASHDGLAPADAARGRDGGGGADLASTRDGGEDGAVAGDDASALDLGMPADLAAPADLTLAAADLAIGGSDAALSGDAAGPPDLARPPDLAGSKDMLVFSDRYQVVNSKCPQNPVNPGVKNPGDACADAVECLGTCCQCMGVANGFYGQLCLGGKCADAMTTCSFIQAKDPAACQ